MSSTAVLEVEEVSVPWSATRSHHMPFGAEVLPGGDVRFSLYGPGVDAVSLALDGQPEPLPMTRDAEGWHTLITPAQPGTRYQLILPDGLRVPDPASRFQPEDVHGPSEIIDPNRYPWQSTAWRGRPWEEAVLYELHIGTFTPEGTFQAAMVKLDHLAGLGVTAIEIMPIADFPGARNWGYDGVLLYAPDSAYGRPEDLKALVDAAHARGISVLLDVVYNHFGPDGNYISLYNPNLQTDRHTTSWGAAINYDGERSDANREFVIHNALYWLEEFHLDGLRLDAVHAILDDSDQHLLHELADRARAAITDRPIHLILENEKNEACRLERDAAGTPRQHTAQWNDDIHHVLHTAGTREDAGYYKDYKGEVDLLGRALAQGFAMQGQCSSCGEILKGEPSAHLPSTAFVAFLQNHDQIGNRAFGERINAIVRPEVVRALASIYLLLPQVPMLFMGEEWCAPQPFPYFCNFADQDLSEKVRNGRRDEFKNFPEFQDPEQRNRIPDPGAESTFLSAKLDWSQLDQPEHAAWLNWYRRILQVRRERIVPMLRSIGGRLATYSIVSATAVLVHWKLDSGEQLHLALNLSDKPQSGFPAAAGELLWQEGGEETEGQFAPWTVRWSLLPSQPSQA